MVKHVFALTAAAMAGFAFPGASQTPPAATYKSGSELVATAKSKLAENPEMGVAPVANEGVYRINVVRRGKPGPVAVHATGAAKGTEVHYIIDGAGTLVTGGKVLRAQDGAAASSSIEGGVTQHVVKGDVVVIPEGTPHWYKNVEGSITYLETRFAVPLKADQIAGPATYKSGAGLLAVVKSKAATSPGQADAPVDNEDAYRINVVRRGIPGNAMAHATGPAKGNEVHYIIDGAATVVTGGTIVRPAGARAGRGGAGAIIEGGVTHHLVKGDVLVIPEGTPHWYKDVEGSVTYLEMRFDTDKK